MAQKCRHRVLDALVVDRLFGLVLVGGHVGEGGDDADKAVRDVVKIDLLLGLVVFVVRLEVVVELPDEGVAHRLVGGAAVFEPARVVVVFGGADLVGEGDGNVHLALVFGLVLAVAGLDLGNPVLHARHAVRTDQLRDMVDHAVLISKGGGVKASAVLVAEDEFHARVDDRLPFHHVEEVVGRDVDVGEHLQIGLPSDLGARVLLGVGLLFQSADVLALLKVKGIAEAVAADVDVHVFRAVLGGAEAEAVHAKGEFIALALVVVVLAARVHLTENQLPVVALFLFVVVDGDAAAVILDLDGAIRKTGHGDFSAVTFARFIDGIGEDLKDRVLAAVDAVGAEDDRGAFAHAVGAFERGDAVVAVFLLFFSWHAVLPLSRDCRSALSQLFDFIP